MDHITYLHGTESSSSTTPAEDKQRRDAHWHRILGAVLWGMGLILLTVASFFFRSHHGPLPGELAFSRAVQGLHLWPWIIAALTFISALNDIPPSAVAIVLCFTGLCLFRKFRQAIFFALTVGIGNGIDALIGDFVGRPRPTPDLIHVDSRLIFNSFPSGHTEHDVVFYGFLLYLSFTRPVREWRYYWLLLPLQIFAGVVILSIGFSRIYEGEHWLTDVLGGYLSGILWLSLFIFLYRRTGEWLEKRSSKKLGQHGT
jgi:undecaprenyl-diphosphatase